VTTSPRFPTVSLTRRLTLRRVATLAIALGAVSVLASAAGIAYVWPLFVFPLILAAVFFFEVGSLVVTFWLANFFVLSYSLITPATEVALRQAAFGTALFLVAGLLLGRVQRRGHEERTRLAASSLTDRLTGLYNYGSFLDHLHYEIAKVDRYGGEVHGFELAQRLRRAVESISLEVRGGQLASVTISAGVATYPSGSAGQSQLVERSDDALYESKRRGRNRVTIHTGTPVEKGAAASLTA